MTSFGSAAEPFCHGCRAVSDAHPRIEGILQVVHEAARVAAALILTGSCGLVARHLPGNDSSHTHPAHLVFCPSAQGCVDRARLGHCAGAVD